MPVVSLLLIGGTEDLLRRDRAARRGWSQRPPDRWEFALPGLPAVPELLRDRAGDRAATRSDVDPPGMSSTPATTYLPGCNSGLAWVLIFFARSGIRP